ncbi:MAG: hypothetical protein ACFCVE_10845 [Phycisphaerae bacterium]
MNDPTPKPAAERSVADALTARPSARTRRIVAAYGLARPAATARPAPARPAPVGPAAVGPAPVGPELVRRLPLPACPPPGHVLLVTGPSGSGKSRLLRRLGQSRSVRWVQPARLRLADAAVVDCLSPLTLEEAVALLNRLGLAEAWLYLKTPRQLSEGQRWRLRLAAAWVAATHRQPLEPDPKQRTFARARRSEIDTDAAESSAERRRAVLLVDEFAAPLDAVSAAVVAHTLRRLITDSPVAAVVATGRDEVADALSPDETVTCDFECG